MPDKDIVKSKVDSVFDLIKTESYRPGHLWNQDMSTINCINGELQFNGGKWELKTHRRENYRTTQINVGYDPAAQAPKTQKFLEWVVAKDGKEGSEKKKLLLQIAGYCLLSTAIYEKIFILYGKGANGKSVYVDLIRHILGDNNHSAVSPCQLGDQFLRAHLHNKLANMVTELKHNEKLADEYIKKIASGETTTAAHKFGHPFDFKPFSTLLFATNHLPKSDDTTEAMRRRVVFVEFTNEISDEDQLAGFSRELAKEASGILNMVLDALSDVLKTGKFTIPRSCLQLSHRWIMQANHVAEFVDEVCQRVDDNDFVAAYYLYAHYRDWASANGVRIQHTKNAFGSSLRALGIQAKKDPTGNFRGYQIRLKYSNILLCPKNIDDSSGLPISSPDTV